SRSEARIFTSIWADPAFLALPQAEQRMYMFLLSQPDLSFCGVLPLRERKWARSAAGLTVQGVRDALTALTRTAPPFIIMDVDTQELMVRSLMRRDKVLKSPK